jgi:uncharacterized protein DUF6504
VSRVYGEPVNVWAQAGRPVRFVWRGRLYTVLRVLEHWVASREWWAQEDQGQAAGHEQRQQAGHEQRRRAGHGQAAGEPAEREFWRVEASPGRSAQSAAYELRLDTATGGWLLARVWD